MKPGLTAFTRTPLGPSSSAACRVSASAARRPRAADRRDVHDRTPARFGHRAAEGLKAEEVPGHVDVERPLPRRERLGEEQLLREDPRVVDEPVDTSMLGEHGILRPRDGGRIGDVGLERRGVGAPALELGRGLLRGREIDVQHDDRCALLRDRGCGAAAEARPGPGDHDHRPPGAFARH
jgi:hypothetical protein